MTKQQYIQEHGRSMLAQALRDNDWPDEQPITVIGGLLAPNNSQSNLWSALGGSKLREYAVGGHRRRGTEGWWIAVA